ncbi:MAG: TetR family transcriptional regulator [Micropruina sp.]|uniref:TetR/AcrR family transcriptional regulator n=1 Tax=Micropruina sp. TaxID=2737536 RepID=UPI0039E28BF1
MPRWTPDARARLVAAALELFSERGYDKTTVTEIAERAGLSKATFFRYFPDKREVLAAGQESLSQLLTQGIAEAPADATPLAAVRAGLARAAGSMTPFHRELGPGLLAVIAANPELQARNAAKQAGLAATMAAALRDRGVPDTVAALAAEVGALAFREAYADWIASDDQELPALTDAALDRLHAAAVRLS